MPNTNGADLVRVFVRNVGGKTAENFIKSSVPFEVVVEAEAGQSVFNFGGPYHLHAVVTDESAVAKVGPTLSQMGTFQAAPWTTPAIQFAFPSIGAQGPGKEDHIYKVTAVLTAGATDPIVDFVEGEHFIITP